MPGKKVGSLDIQFAKDWDSVKGNQLVQSLQQVISAVNVLSSETVTPIPGVAVHELADQVGLGPDHTVAGLEENQVLIAQSAITAHFDFLHFGQIFGTDSGTFTAPTNGDVIGFVNGYWTATPLSGALGLTDPGTDALIQWDTTANAGAGGLAWSLPGTGITLMSGSIAVNDHQLTHGHLLGLLADDHPQYALVADTPLLGVANVFTALNTFNAGLTVLGTTTLTGDLEQSGAEPEQHITNTDDASNEGSWRLHIEPGQWMQAAVNDDGSDAEDWLYVQRNADQVQTIGLEAEYLTFNGFDVVTADLVAGAPYVPLVIAGQVINVAKAGVSSGSGSSPLTTKGDLYGHSTVDARVPIGADGTILTADSTQTLGLKWGAAPGSAITTLTQAGGTSQTYTVPAGAKMLQVICIGGGGGGGGGGKFATNSGGGGGGGGGGIGVTWLSTALLGASVTVGFSSTTGGAGGALQNTATSNGNPGTTGATVNFGPYLLSTGGVGGTGGTIGGAGTGGSGGSGIFGTGTAGGTSGLGGGGAAASGASTAYAPTNFSPTGGGSGGSLNASVPNGGGVGGSGGAFLSLAGGTAGAAGVAGGNGSAGNTHSPASGGGGGGGSATIGANGGTGGAFGAGGGGGGASLNAGTQSGAGGNGGGAACIVIAY